MKAENYLQKRESILSVFKQAEQDLAVLNKDIEKEIAANQAELDRLRAENESLQDIREDNTKAMKFFGKIFKS